MEWTVTVGFGDLGQPLTNKARKSGFYPVIYDRDPQVIAEYRAASDSSRTVANQPISDEFAVCDDLEELVCISGVVNFAVPASALQEFPVLGDSQLGIMHDSVMSSSYNAIHGRGDGDRHKYSIAHLLMNRHERAILDPEHGDVQKVNDYLQRLGLSVILMGYKEHDQMMAQSQGAMLGLMVRYGHTLRLLQAAQLLEERPVLKDLDNSLKTRNAEWTDATIESIMRNPYSSLNHDDVKRYIDRKLRLKSRTSKGITVPFLSEVLEVEASVEEADRIEAEFMDFAQANIGTLTAMNDERLLTPSSEELLHLLMRNSDLATL